MGQRLDDERRLGNTPEQERGQRFVWDIAKYEGRSARLLGIRELEEIGARIPTPFFVVTHQAFQIYKQSEMIPTKVKEELLSSFREIREKNPHRGVYVGWRTVTPEGIPPGPRTSAILNEDRFIEAVENAWQFAITKGFDREENEVVLALHPFIHAAQEPRPAEFFLWQGGEAAPRADGTIIIRAGFGPDEITQGYTVDEYIVRLGKTITEILKKIAPKTLTLIPSEGKYEEISIPPPYQDKQALADSSILRIAEVVRRLSERFGHRRVEFIAQEEGLIFREVEPYDPEPENFYFLREDLKEPAVVINSFQDIEKVRPPKAIVYLPPHLFQRRMMPDISLLLVGKALKDKIEMAILTYGQIETQHMVNNFRKAGITVLFAGDKPIQEGQLISVSKGKNGHPSWEIIGEKKETLIDLTDPQARKREVVGEKAANLAIIQEERIPTPPGFSVPTVVLEKYLHDLDLNGMLDKLNSLEGEALVQHLERIREIILKASLPSSLVAEIEINLAQYSQERFSVRSSSPDEDIAAGQFRTFLNVTKGDVPNKVRDCLASLFSLRAVTAARNSGLSPSTMRMAVLIHPMIEGKGGVIHARGEGIVIFTAETPELVTSGAATETYHKITLTIRKGVTKIKEEVPLGGALLNPKEAEELASLAVKIQDVLGPTQDIEWVIDKTGKIYILQSRPI